MSDEQFRQLCNTFGFAPSRALREMLDAATKQEREACAKVCDELEEYKGHACAYSIRARKENT